MVHRVALDTSLADEMLVSPAKHTGVLNKGTLNIDKHYLTQLRKKRDSVRSE